jgi:hypothetical protein
MEVEIEVKDEENTGRSLKRGTQLQSVLPDLNTYLSV